MKYEKCLTCHELGKTCDGPNFLAMDASELGKWCNEKRKNDPNMTYDKIALQTGISKSTVFSFLHGEHDDFRFSTIRPIAQLIIGGDWDDNACGNITNSERAQYEERIQQLEKDVAWRDDKIAYLTKNHEVMQTLITDTNKRNTESQEFLHGQIKNRNKSVAFLASALVVSVLLIIAALVIDISNPNVGYIWFNNSVQMKALFIVLSAFVLVCITWGIIWGVNKKKKAKEKKVVSDITS